jgi:hypothetical protein
MKPIPVVSEQDIAAAFIGELSPRQQRKQANRDSRERLLAQFREAWRHNLGDKFDLPTEKRIFTWLRASEYDWPALSATIDGLRSRAKHPFDPRDPRGHMLRWFTAALTRRLRGKYGPPPLKKAA